MARIDVFNGDADGICALHQLRLAEPAEATLVTGPKRAIDLLQRVRAQPGDTVTVCDISLDINAAALMDLLARGVDVLYFDHHAATQRPAHPNLRGAIDTSPDVCTSALVDRFLSGAHRPWAVVAAFGDGMPSLAQRLAEPLQLGTRQVDQLRELGELLNYNAYGEHLADLLIHPEQLYRLLAPHRQPASFLEQETRLVAQLRALRERDAEHLRALQPAFANAGGAVYLLPDASWSRRVRGDFSNQIAQREPQLAHAVLSVNEQGGYMVSVRAPLVRNRGADVLCTRFTSGGGRAAAGGINHLPPDQLDSFVREFFAAFAS
jgi:hypothetical protein